MFREQQKPFLVSRLSDILSSPALPTSCGSQVGHRYQLLHVPLSEATKGLKYSCPQ
ncbi:MAG TPA: hypothetical protein VFG06_09710 [Thermodesulfovibrionales bacterium]|nr:hypothetical protein [Thermodesulfovibrionales bacterium]